MQGSTNAKLLRKNPTEAEKALWCRLRGRRFNQYKFRRQAPVGPYAADFVCMSLRMVVELDGGQHARQTEYDCKCDSYLRSKGYEIVRYWNNDVLSNMDGVLSPLTLALSLRERELEKRRME